MNIQSLFTPEILILLEVVFVGALFLFLLINKNFTYGIYIWLVSLLFFKHQRMDFAGSALPYISIDRIFFVFLIMLFSMQVLTKRRKLFPPTRLEYSMFWFCLLAIISMIWTGLIAKDGGGLRIGELLTGYIFPFSMFFISQNVYDTAKKRESFIKFLLLVGLYLCLTAIFEHFNMDKFIFPRYILDRSVGIHFERARGPFVQAAVNGTILGLVFTVLFYFLFNSKRRTIWKIYSAILLILTPLAIFFTYTRAAWIGAFLGFAVIAIFAFREKKGVAIILTIILCIAALSPALLLMDDNTIALASERAVAESPIYDRMNLYIASINMFVHHPLLGVGFGKFSELAPGYFRHIDGIPFRYSHFTEHDTFVGVLAEMGIVGITLILLIYFFILKRSIRLYKNFEVYKPAARFIVVIFWGFAAVYIANSMFIEMRFFEFVNCLFFIFAGIICGWQRSYDEKEIKENEVSYDRAISA